MVLQMQQINTLNEKIAIMNARHFGRSTGKLDTLPGQMNIYNEADTAAAETIAELVVPSTIVVLKAENRRGLRPPDVQKLQNIMLLNLCRFQQESFIQNQQLGTHVFHLDLLVAVLHPGYLQLQRQIRQTDIFGFEALLTGFHAQGTGHMGLATA